VAIGLVYLMLLRELTWLALLARSDATEDAEENASSAPCAGNASTTSSSPDPATSTSCCASTCSIAMCAARTDHCISTRPRAPLPHVPGATVRPLRRDRLGGLIHEYVQAA
jgi:hypothetical protein